MELERLKEILRDERSGLFILAGMDGDAQSRAVLTVHAWAGALSAENRHFIETGAASVDAAMAVRFRQHSSEDLNSPDSLESFAGLFAHDEIVADPTGAFGRMSSLVLLARRIRVEHGGDVRSILWRSNASALVVVAPAVADRTGLETAIRALIDRPECACLRSSIRSVGVESAAPSGRFTPVDGLSRPARPAPSRLAGLLARVSGMAALVGLGAMSAAQAATPPADLDDIVLTPGITALVDLTTLGENAHGGRNRFQAIGGLRLYFGGSGTLVASAAGDIGIGAPQGDDLAGVPVGNGDLADKLIPAVPMPVRIAYGF